MNEVERHTLVKAARAAGGLECPSGLVQLITLSRPPQGTDLTTACWLWRGRRDTEGRSAGYGRVGRSERAHLIVYTLLVGPIPRGMVLDHLCRRRHCVNPLHLEIVSQRENMYRNRRLRCRNGHDLYLTGRPSGRRNQDGTRGRTCGLCRNTRRRAKRAAGANA